MLYIKVGHFASEPVLLGLIRAKWMPILLYGIESCPLLTRQISSLEVFVNTHFCAFFCTNLPVTVKQCQDIFWFSTHCLAAQNKNGKVFTEIYWFSRNAMFIIWPLCNIRTNLLICVLNMEKGALCGTTQWRYYWSILFRFVLMLDQW
jgi:hypothetical protein